MSVELKNEIIKRIHTAEKIAISSHVRPDADSIGSGLALTYMLNQLGKKVCFCNIDRAPFPISQLPGYDLIEYRQIYPEAFDLLFLIEGGTEERTQQRNINHYYTVNIDHHTTSTYEANLNWVVPEAAAVGELIYELGIALGIEFNRAIAFNLYASIASDTGSFKYSNTTHQSLFIASELVKMGHFSPGEVSNLLFNSNYYEKIKMTQKVLSTLELQWNNQVAIVEFRRDFLNKFSLKDIETEDIISIVRSIMGVRVTLFFKEIDTHYYRISIRSKGDISSQKVARHFGGGGHDHAAGFFYQGDIVDAKHNILTEIKKQA